MSDAENSLKVSAKLKCEIAPSFIQAFLDIIWLVLPNMDASESGGHSVNYEIVYLPNFYGHSQNLAIVRVNSLIES